MDFCKHNMLREYSCYINKLYMNKQIFYYMNNYNIYYIIFNYMNKQIFAS